MTKSCLRTTAPMKLGEYEGYEIWEDEGGKKADVPEGGGEEEEGVDDPGADVGVFQWTPYVLVRCERNPVSPPFIHKLASTTITSLSPTL